MLIETLLAMVIKAAVFGGVAATVFVLICLNWERIVAFMSDNAALKESDMDNIGFSLQEKMDSGEYKTVYGIFNTRTSKVLNAEAVRSSQVDTEVSEMHEKTPLIVFH